MTRCLRMVLVFLTIAQSSDARLMKQTGRRVVAITPLLRRLEEARKGPWLNLRGPNPVAMSTATAAAETGGQTSTPVSISSRQMRALQANLGLNTALTVRSTHTVQVGEPPLEVSRLRDLLGTEYTGTLGVGTRGSEAEAELSVIFDTGSSDLWVASDLCGLTSCARGRPRYNHSHSETFRHPAKPLNFSTGYGSGVISGELGIDTVRVGPLVSLGQEVGLIAETHGPAFEMLPLDGIVGLGFPDIALDPAMPFFANLVAQGLVQYHCFAFYLHPDPALGGGVLWGGVDHRLYKGSLQWFPIVEKGYWALELVAFEVGQRVFNFSSDEKAPLLVVDSGTTFFTAEGSIYRALRESLQAAPCGQVGRLPSLVYSLRDRNGVVQRLTIAPEEYMVDSGGLFAGACFPAFVSMGPVFKRPMMILGEVFMRHYFTVFDWGVGQRGQGAQVGIAPVRSGSESEAFFLEAAAGAKEAEH